MFYKNRTLLHARRPQNLCKIDYETHPAVCWKPLIDFCGLHIAEIYITNDGTMVWKSAILQSGMLRFCDHLIQTGRPW